MNRKTFICLIILFLLVLASLPVMAAQQDKQNTNLKIKSHHFFIVPVDQGTIMVEEKIVLSNLGNVNGGSLITFSLPKGFKRLELVDGLGKKYLQEKDGKLIINNSLPEDVKVIAFNYHLQSDEANFLISKKVDYSTENLYIWTLIHGIEITGKNIENSGIQNINGSHYKVFRGQNFAPGEKLVFTAAIDWNNISSGGEGSVTEKSPKFHSPGHIRFWKQSPFSGIDAHLLILLIIIIPAVMISYAVYSRKKYAAETNTDEEEEELFRKLVKKQESLKRKLVEIEKQRIDNELTEENYTRLREEYKKRLIQVKIKLRELSE